VTLFDRGRGAGGRCSTRVEGGAAFDHGAPGFAATDARWRSWVDGWEDEGAVARWGEGFVGAPSMSSLLKRMLHGLDARFGVDVTSAEHGVERWRLVGADGHGLGEFDALVVAVPAPQAAALLKWSAPELATLAEGAVMSPRWTLMLGLDAALDAADVLEVGTAPFERLLRQSARPGRAPGERWVAHASAGWSLAHLEEASEAVAAALLDAFWAVTGGRRQQPRVLAAHRWRFARVEQALKVQCLFAPGPKVVACGDWCLADGVEAAFLSGTAAAGRILSLPGAAVAPSSPPAPGAQLRLL
jgi:predicted NAD/FAD-dependent oxidoreductase